MSTNPSDLPTTNALELATPPTGAQIEIVKRGFFHVVINSADPKPLVTLDVTMLPARTQELLTAAPNQLQDAMDVEVGDEEMFNYATEQRRIARDAFQALEDSRTSITGRIAPFNEAVMSVFRGDKTRQDGPTQLLKQAMQLYDQKLIAYSEQQTALRKQKEAEGREKLEAEKRRIAAEQRRVEQEAAERAAELRRKAEEASRIDHEQATELFSQANEVEATASEDVTALGHQAAMLQPQPVGVRGAPRASSGFTITTKKKLRVNDPMLFFQGIVDGKIPKVFGSWDQKALDKQAALLGDDLDYPGCEVYEDKGGSSR